MHEATTQELPHHEDGRPQKFKEIGDALRSKDRFGLWQTLDDEELHCLTMPPGDRGVPGPDETRELLGGFGRYCKRLLDGCRFEARVVDGEHQVRYVSALRPEAKT
jgi:hypothetical protein